MSDRETLEVYDRSAAEYATRFTADGVSKHLTRFIAALPDRARVLDLGCGPGNAARAMAAAGFRVEAWDASAEMVGLAGRDPAVSARQARFDALDARTSYDGIHANFSLLHAPKIEMPDHLARIARALRPSGVFHIGMKTGTGEARDALGRFYAYYEEEELTALLAAAGLSVIATDRGRDKGLAGTVDPWMILLARKND